MKHSFFFSFHELAERNVHLSFLPANEKNSCRLVVINLDTVYNFISLWTRLIETRCFPKCNRVKI